MARERVDMSRPGYMAAASLLFVAVGNPSLLGSAFLLLFLAWTLFCVPFIRSPRGLMATKALWGAAAGVSGIACALQLGVQLALAAGAPGIHHPIITRVLEILGVSRVSSGWDVLLTVLPLAIAIVATSHQAAVSSRMHGTHRRQLQEGVEVDTLRSYSRSATSSPSEIVSNPVIIAVLGLLGAALARPALLSLPYLVALCLILARWGAGERVPGRKLSPWLVLLQTYSAAHLVGLYAWQWGLSYASPLRPIADILGLFILDFNSQSQAELAQGAVAVTSLLAVAVSLGMRRAQDVESDDLSQEEEELTASLLEEEEERWTRDVAESESLGEEDITNHRQHRRPQIGYWQWMREVLPFCAIVSVSWWSGIFYHAGAVAAAMCLGALVRPSVVGGCLLIAGALSLQRPWAASIAPRLSAIITFFVVLVWLGGCYVATALRDVLSTTPLVDAIGVHPFKNGAPLLAILGLLAAVSTNLRGIHRSLQRTTSGALPWWVQQHPSALQALEVIMVCALPLAAFAVGSSRYDFIHASLLVGLVIALCSPALQLKPLLSLATKPHIMALLRAYVGIALVSMYTVNVGGMAAFHGVLQPKWAEDVLTALGLWQPSIGDMALFAGLLTVAAAHCYIVHAASAPSTQQNAPTPTVHGVPTRYRWWRIKLSRKAATYGTSAIAVVLYCIVLFNCDVAAVGLTYMCLGVWCLAVQPAKGQWMDRMGGTGRLQALMGIESSTPEEIVNDVPLSPLSPRSSRNFRGFVLVGSPATRWIPLTATAVVATLDFVVQAALPAVVAAGWPLFISTDVLDFLRDAIGIDAYATGSALALRLLRPVLILGCLTLYRRLYCLGTLHRQLAHALMDDSAYERHRIAKQWGSGALLKRILILHASKAVVILAFAAAMQIPSALGWTLVVGLVVVLPAMGPGRSPTPLIRTLAPVKNRAALDAALAAAQTLASLWLLAQYTVQISWVKSALAPSEAGANLLAWLGVDASGGEDPPAPSYMECLLRFKAALLAAVALNQRALLWWAKLPAIVRDEAKCGAACPVFWPPAPGWHPPSTETPEDTTTTLLEPQIGAATLPQPITVSARVALHTVAQRARTLRNLAQQALQAVDWPSPAIPEILYTGDEDGDGGDDVGMHSATSQSPRPGSQIDPNESNLEGSSTSNQLIAFRFAAQDWIERCYDDWGLEIALFALLFAAFLAANALSLGYMVAVAFGMVAPPRLRQLLWKWTVMPALGIVLLWQYSELVGWPPSGEHDDDGGSGVGLHFRFKSPLTDDVRAWLGLQNVDPVAVWALFFAFVTSVLQVYCDRGKKDGATCAPSSSATAPLLASSEPSARPSSQLWAPLRHSTQPSWRWHDWMRYTVYRKSLDFLLVAVVALCTLDNDIIHAGYLALALFFFRSRVALRARRNALFMWLPLYNFAVMAVVLAYQAPFEDVWDWPLDDGKSCTLAHLLGLYKLRPSASPDGPPPDTLVRSSLLSWGYEGAIADLILWVCIRFQTHMFASPTYLEVVAVAEAEEEEERAGRKKEVAEWKQEQAASAVKDSQQRAARAVRISRIQEGVDRSLSLFTAGVNPTNQDFAFLEMGSGALSPRPSMLRLRGDSDVPEVQMSGLRRRVGVRKGRRDTAHEGAQADVPSSSSGPGPEQEPSPAMLTEYEQDMAIALEPAVAGAVQKLKNEESGEPPETRSNGITAAWRWITTLVPRRADRRESALAYALFVFAYLSDLSLLALVLPVSAFVYALVAVRPARTYWHVVLVYCETIIVASYAFEVPARLNCGFISPDLQRIAEMLGIHTNAVRCIPLFLVYLATLRHTHGLMTRHAAGQRAAAAAGAMPQPSRASPGLSPSSGKNMPYGQRDLEIGGIPRGDESANNDEDEDFYADDENQRIGMGDSTGLNRINSEGIITIHGPPSDQGSSWVTSSFESIAKGMASVCEFILTACTACERPPAFLLAELQTSKSNGPDALRTGDDVQRALQDILDGQRARALHQEQVTRIRSSASLSESTWEGMRPSAAATDSAPASSALAHVSPLDLRFHSFLDSSVLPHRPPHRGVSPENSGTSSKKRTMFVLLEVLALHSTPDNTPDVCTIPGWPLRSLRPAATAAEALTSAPPTASGVEVVSAAPHGRQARDFYAATAALDILAFLFVAVYYNRVVSGAGSLSEITSQHVVPLGYLIILMTLFMFVVLDRVVYTLGSAVGKAALHLAEMTLFFWYCSTLVWSPADPAAHPPRDHLRVLLALKAASFALSALQLRTGYPPPASYANGMGRHTFVFMRSVSVPSSLAFHAFAAVPFLYEMRQLLDWSCTATTLTLYDWLKLEDINMSLYFSAVMRTSRASRPPGTRQPRYLKFFQGTLLFAGLLVLLWVPLLVFSTGNPTYQVPDLASFSVNATLRAYSPTLGPVSAHLFRGGDRGAWKPWISGPNATAQLPDALAADYSPQQLQLLCTPGDADAVWVASPPSRRAMSKVLDSTDADVAMIFGWDVLRDLPPPSDHGGPNCAGTATVDLSTESRQDLLSMLRGEIDSAQLLRSIDGGENVTTALFPMFWLMRGDACISRPLQDGDIRGADALPSRRLPVDLSWTNRWLACNTSLQGGAEDGGQWWRLQCDIVDSDGAPISDDDTRWPITCPSYNSDDSTSDQSDPTSLHGPRIIAVLDRVQGGIIGATLTKFGVIGLYTVFVYGIGRFLRLSVTNLRMRIPYEDLPTTRRLVELCQDIYIARAEGLLGLEEELYNALLSVYRLPTVMFELTKKGK